MLLPGLHFDATLKNKSFNLSYECISQTPNNVIRIFGEYI